MSEALSKDLMLTEIREYHRDDLTQIASIPSLSEPSFLATEDGAGWIVSNHIRMLLDHIESQAARIASLERDKASLEKERDEWKDEAQLATHKCITCGVAASNPDATLTERGAYAKDWGSPQAQQVRALRKERDELRAAISQRKP